MDQRAFAMFDALGFKNLWRKYEQDPAIVIKKLRALKHAMAQQTKTTKPLRRTGPYITESADVSFLSDTIVVSVRPGRRLPIPPLAGAQHGRAVLAAAFYASSVMNEASRSQEPHLAYRGAIGFGQCLKDGAFIIGPAVDEVVSVMDRAQGAFVWLAPSALRAWKAAGIEIGLLVPYAVPLKGGDAFQTMVVDPTWYMGRARAAEFVLRLDSTFDHLALDVQIKRQNTAAFFRARMEHPERRWGPDED
jgi:hypothetical protein